MNKELKIKKQSLVDWSIEYQGQHKGWIRGYRGSWILISDGLFHIGKFEECRKMVKAHYSA